MIYPVPHVVMNSVVYCLNLTLVSWPVWWIEGVQAAYIFLYVNKLHVCMGLISAPRFEDIIIDSVALDNQNM